MKTLMIVLICAFTAAADIIVEFNKPLGFNTSCVVVRDDITNKRFLVVLARDGVAVSFINDAPKVEPVSAPIVPPPVDSALRAATRAKIAANKGLGEVPAPGDLKPKGK